MFASKAGDYQLALPTNIAKGWKSPTYQKKI